MIPRDTPEGTAVKVRRDNGDILETKTRSKVWLLNNIPVVLVDGISGCYMAERMDKI